MKWYAVYTKPRWEKKVSKGLSNAGIECYLPLIKRKKNYSGRFRDVDEIVIPSYIFVRVKKENQTDVRYVEGVINYVYWQGKVAEISDTEIDALKQYLINSEKVIIENWNLQIGTEIIINNKLYKNQKAIIETINKNKVVLYLTTLHMKMTIDFNKLQNE